MTADLSTEKLTWKGNLLHGAALGAKIPAITSDPLIEKSGGRLIPKSSGSVIDAAAIIDTVIASDITGRNRPLTGLDIGADEISGASGNATHIPLTPFDTGAKFLRP